MQPRAAFETTSQTTAELSACHSSLRPERDLPRVRRDGPGGRVRSCEADRGRGRQAVSSHDAATVPSSSAHTCCDPFLLPCRTVLINNAGVVRPRAVLGSTQRDVDLSVPRPTASPPAYSCHSSLADTWLSQPPSLLQHVRRQLQGALLDHTGLPARHGRVQSRARRREPPRTTATVASTRTPLTALTHPQTMASSTAYVQSPFGVACQSTVPILRQTSISPAFPPLTSRSIPLCRRGQQSRRARVPRGARARAALRPRRDARADVGRVSGARQDAHV